MIKYFIIIFGFSISGNLFAQHGHDHVWPLGYQRLTEDPYFQTEEGRRLWGYYSFDFNGEVMRIIRNDERLMPMNTTVSMYCDSLGNMLFYSNGQSIKDSTYTYTKGAEKIGNNNESYWNQFLGTGYNAPQAILMLPWPGQDSLAVVYALGNSDLPKFVFDVFSHTIVDMSDPTAYKAVLVDKVLKNGSFKSGKITATRHANGRDWWIIFQSFNGVEFYTYLLDKEGFHEQDIQKIGKFHRGFDWGQAYFSQQGDQYAIIDALYWDSSTLVSIYKFDRCTGLLSNRRTDTITNYSGSLSVGISFSPSGQYLYACNEYKLYQYDTKAMSFTNSKKNVAKYDGFINDPTWPVETGFGVFAAGSDGRLYNFTGQGGSLHIHQMDFPDETGEACTFKQHAITAHFQERNAPNFPNYRLGPLDGSPCDTLGLDNHPIAKYRYEPDTIDHLRIRFTDLSYFRPETWSWDFGDGDPRVSMRHPYHNYAAAGMYNVCLNVSNENSSNTFCRTITIGTSSIDDGLSVAVADITLFPNPVADYLLVTLGEYIPQHGQMMIYDISGRPVHTQRIYYGQNNVDMTRLATGMYVWKMMDGLVEIRSGKVVKI